MKLEITHDDYCKSPLKYSGMELVTFDRSNVYDYIKLIDKVGDPVPANIGIRRRLDCGTAFLVSKYEHGLIKYGLFGEVRQCQWDTTRFYGILLLDACEHYHTFQDRESAARSMLESYTMWANGECYEWVPGASSSWPAR